jgi:hypothetical protein
MERAYLRAFREIWSSIAANRHTIGVERYVVVTNQWAVMAR